MSATIEQHGDYWHVRHADATVGKHRAKYKAREQADRINNTITESEKTMADATFHINQHEHVEAVLPSGRIVHIWLCDHEDHESIDIWLTDGQENHAISERTGAKDRAPMGVFGMYNGTRAKMHDTGFTEHKWPAVSTMVLMFDKPVGTD